MALLSTLLSFTYPPPPSIFVNAITVASVVAIPFIGLSKARGFAFSTRNSGTLTPATRTLRWSPVGLGWLCSTYLLFLPVLFVSLGMFPDMGLRLALMVHFLKRVLEVLFVHKFSTRMAVDSMLVISFSYFLITTTMIYSLHLCQNLFPEPSIDLMYPGVALFLIGIGGNFYHHLLLSQLRTKGEKEYKIPSGGLFDSVICPHYLFEVIGFVGIAFICQMIYSFAVALNTISYLAGRSYATRRWYESKFEDFPEGVKALIPYIF